jgi:hypothetical protein
MRAKIVSNGGRQVQRHGQTSYRAKLQTLALDFFRNRNRHDAVRVVGLPNAKGARLDAFTEHLFAALDDVVEQKYLGAPFLDMTLRTPVGRCGCPQINEQPKLFIFSRGKPVSPTLALPQFSRYWHWRRRPDAGSDQ